MFLPQPLKIRELIRLRRQVQEPIIRCGKEMRTTLMSLADEADLLITGMLIAQLPAGVAEYYDIPLAALHYFPIRPNGQLLPFLPAPLVRSLMTVDQSLGWRRTKKLENAHRRELGLPEATGPVSRWISERGSLEIQAYDEVIFPGLAAEWAKFGAQRPFVGTLTLGLATDADEEVKSWIAAGTPPIYFGFGSIPVESPADTIAMIAAVCARLGERALVCAGWSDFTDVPHFEHVKIVDAVNHAAIFPACRAVVHHGGGGTMAAGLRAGVPQVILFLDPFVAINGAAVKRLKVATSRRFSTATEESLVADLRTVLAPQYVARAREFATQMTEPAKSAAAAADLLEDFASSRRAG